MDLFRAMRVYARVVETGSLRKAAETLDVSSATVSMTVSQLEDHLRTALLLRSTRGITVTPEGLAYFHRCRSILEDVEAAETETRQAVDNLHGVLRVDMPTSIANSVITPALSAFREAYPAIELVMGISDRQHDIIADGIDCVIRTGELVDSSLISRRLATFDWLVCASPSYLARAGEITDPADISDHDVIGYFYRAMYSGEKWPFLIDSEWRDIPVNAHFAVNDTREYLSLALQGHGIVRLADFLVRPYLQSGELVQLFPGHGQISTPVYGVFSSSRKNSPLVRIFLDWVAGLFLEKAKG
ncbi:LysR family transcriptional regulator [Thalassospira marina]|uniref:LysR family transcriptional regulator n=1 Tax=Thalassospira marina TaxID=2048283 RepID=A0ABN5FEL2_9PROT|nr:LysR family transcriptional regulator [Thalassospira marina]AUG53473.1 LysR family transcriptional regulator [Thalassospira marina]